MTADQEVPGSNPGAPYQLPHLLGLPAAPLPPDPAASCPGLSLSRTCGWHTPQRLGPGPGPAPGPATGCSPPDLRLPPPVPRRRTTLPLWGLEATRFPEHFWLVMASAGRESEQAQLTSTWGRRLSSHSLFRARQKSQGSAASWSGPTADQPDFIQHRPRHLRAIGTQDPSHMPGSRKTTGAHFPGPVPNLACPILLLPAHWWRALLLTASVSPAAFAGASDVPPAYSWCPACWAGCSQP